MGGLYENEHFAILEGELAEVGEGFARRMRDSDSGGNGGLLGSAGACTRLADASGDFGGADRGSLSLSNRGRRYAGSASG